MDNILIQSSYETAVNNIPNMIISKKLICIIGYINNSPIKILIDTGASCSLIFLHTIERLKLDYLVDNNSQVCLQGIGNEITIGRLWYIDLKINKMNYPSSFIVSNNIIDFDIIIGINFLQTYKGVIDFGNNILKLNNNKISFNY
jgi:hypothetical protein